MYCIITQRDVISTRWRRRWCEDVPGGGTDSAAAPAQLLLLWFYYQTKQTGERKSRWPESVSTRNTRSSQFVKISLHSGHGAALRRLRRDKMQPCSRSKMENMNVFDQLIDAFKRFITPKVSFYSILTSNT